jgi:hypothetical protein
MNDEQSDFERFMKRREEVARSYVQGDAEPLGRIVTHGLPATFFSPQGGHLEGAEEVSATYQRDATEWKMVHWHADSLASKSEGNQK